LCQILDSDSPERWAVIRNENLRKRTQSHREEIESIQHKIDELKQEAEHKAREFVQRRKGLSAGFEKVIRAEEAKAARESEVMQLEHFVVELEYRLNFKLKEAASLTGYTPPPEVFADEGGRNQRVEEITQIVGIVAVDREV
jgi:chromosome segregation ATPase